MPSVVWEDWPSMTAISPVAGASVGNPNPVILIQNMVKTDDGILRRRAAFDLVSAVGTIAYQNGIVCNLDGLATLVLKGTDGIYSTTSINSNPSDIGWTELPDSNARGSFAAYSGEVYYCDQQTILRWDRASAPVAPGMPYYDRGAYVPDVLTFDSDEDVTNDSRWWETLASAGELRQGGKTGTIAVSYSWYDPIRDIYGPRSRPEIIVIAAVNGSTPIKLFGVNHTLSAPDDLGTLTVDPNWKVAVWCSPSISSRVIQTQTDCVADGSSNTCTFSVKLSHQFGEYLTDLQFFEALTPDSGVAAATSTVNLRADNSTLAARGRALDTFEAPHPSDFMTILPDGTALYLNPQLTPEGAGTPRLLVEYSIGHPEQIGRDREDFPFRRSANGPTTTHLSNVRGRPLASTLIGTSPVLLTDQGSYVINFDGGAMTASSIGQGRGVRGTGSIAESSLGMSYLADDGWVLISEQGSTLLDRVTKNSGYLRPLTNGQRINASGGSYQDQAMLFVPEYDPFDGTPVSSINDFALVYDHVLQHMVAFKLKGGAEGGFAIDAALQDGHKMLLFTPGGDMYAWPGTGGQDNGDTTFDHKVVMAMGERNEFNKRIRSLKITYGDMAPTEPAPLVTVESYDAWDETVRGYRSVQSYGYPDEPGGGTPPQAILTANRTVNYPDFNSLQGRFFKITVEADATFTEGVVEIAKVQVEYDVDDDEAYTGTH